jgi:hypothetical protein
MFLWPSCQLFFIRFSGNLRIQIMKPKLLKCALLPLAHLCGLGQLLFVAENERGKLFA